MIIELLFATILGLLFGSFLNVIILRIPQGQSIAYPPSHCPACTTQLKWWHNIPLLSWLLLGGKCAYCKSPISLQYPIIELLSATIFAVVYLKSGFTLYALAIAIVFDLLLALSLIDWRFKAVPDSINLTAAMLSVFASAHFLDNLHNALIIAGILAMLRFFVGYYVSKKEDVHIRKKLKETPWLAPYYPKFPMIEAMGEGDIIVGFTLGAILGVQLSFVSFFLAALIALPFSLAFRYQKADRELPFIPFLALGGFIAYLFGNEILGVISA
ncbi:MULTISPECIES: A24 family peptidase [unclassified Nitratiruptor]|uniref:prepilin peptidase n=1 Tax=unclassified Nitratiruptor TaxID=2624044 RepID=UPI001915AE1E|nr:MULTISPECIES: A24 family peptidase [unclassified Nitratiruptor]BCD60171.1 leader peptidase / N-methyltransferase [Nitratiruptor sp. YY08-10]BCD64341.1 leader peptidase / N-methyltransferase [Nitratiruptor sp. YY08-14]